MADYTHQFNIHAPKTGWEVRTLVSQYRQGLKQEIKIPLITSRVEFKTVEDVAKMAIEVDNAINGITSHVDRPTADPNAMDLSAIRGLLTDEERRKMLREGRCFRCQRTRHLSKDCPGRKTPKGKEKARVMELEDSDQSKNGNAQD